MKNKLRISALLFAIAMMTLAGTIGAYNTRQSGERGNVDHLDQIILRDVHPLYGGQNLYLARDGTGFCQLVSRRPGVSTFFEKRYRVALPADAMQKLLRLMSEHSFIDIASSVKPGLPDSARPKISARFASGKSVSVDRWIHDNDPDFDAIYQTLLDIVRSVQTGKLAYEGQYDLKWVPDEFIYK